MAAEDIRKEIHTVFDTVIGALGDLRDDIVDKVPFKGSWTIGQVGEHIIRCSSGIPDSTVQPAERAYDENVAALRRMFSDRSQKSKAAPGVYPQEAVHTVAGLTAQLAHNKAQLLHVVGGRNLTSLCMDMEFPSLGYLTRYEWLTFVCVHTQWHLHQITAIRRHLEARAVG